MNGLGRTFLGLFVGWIALMIGSSTYHDDDDDVKTKNHVKSSNIHHHHKNHQQEKEAHDFLRPFGQYPNLLNITKEERDQYHPIVKFPYMWKDVVVPTEDNDDNNDDDETTKTTRNTKTRKKRIRVPKYTVLDLQTTSAVDELVSKEERDISRQLSLQQQKKPMVRKLLSFLVPKNKNKKQQQQQSNNKKNNNNKKKHQKKNDDDDDDDIVYAVGRYDEHRPYMYASHDLFDNPATNIDGYDGARTVHMGIDLDGPVGTPVYSFTGHGIVIASGYNPALGDYGNTIVIQYDLGRRGGGGGGHDDHHHHNHDDDRRILYVLYGHLNDASIRDNPVGKRIRRGGQRIGRMGDIHENGGWKLSHVHVQLSLIPPATHDMPGVVSLQDRNRALLVYPDPRYILGELY